MEQGRTTENTSENDKHFTQFTRFTLRGMGVSSSKADLFSPEEKSRSESAVSFDGLKGALFNKKKKKKKKKKSLQFLRKLSPGKRRKETPFLRKLSLGNRRKSSPSLSKVLQPLRRFTIK